MAALSLTIIVLRLDEVIWAEKAWRSTLTSSYFPFRRRLGSKEFRSSSEEPSTYSPGIVHRRNQARFASTTLQSHEMDLKRLITHFTYRIEPKPDGGFIARPSDPTLPPLEASTRAELQQKIQANIVSALAVEFPGLKLPLENKASYVFHIETKTGGAFALHSADPNINPLEAASHVEIQNHFAEKLMDFVGKHLTPELSKVIAASASAGNVQLFVNMKTGANVDLNSPELKVVSLQSAGSSMQANSSNQGNDANLVRGNFTKPEAIGNSPITPEAGNWNFFRLLLALLVIVLAIYFFLHHH